MNSCAHFLDKSDEFLCQSLPHVIQCGCQLELLSPGSHWLLHSLLCKPVQPVTQVGERGQSTVTMGGYKFHELYPACQEVKTEMAKET